MKKLLIQQKNILLVFLILLGGITLLEAQERPTGPRPSPTHPHYRGRRMMEDPTLLDSQKSFYIEHIIAKQTKKGPVFILIFNLPINPLSIKPHNVVINGKELPAETPFRFNKAGNFLMFPIPLQFLQDSSNFDFFKTLAENQELEIEARTINLQITELLSFNGKPLEDKRHHD